MDSTRVDRIFRAFADPTRLRMLHLLSRRRELCVCDLTRVLRLPQPTVSRHLGYLRRAGLVRDRRAGYWRHYSLAEPEGRFHAGLLSCLKGCFGEVGELRRDLERLRGPVRKVCLNGAKK